MEQSQKNPSNRKRGRFFGTPFNVLKLKLKTEGVRFAHLVSEILF